MQAVDGWIARGRAVVARRRDADASGHVAVAIALPVSAGRARIAFAVDARAVMQVAPPLTLHEAVGVAPPDRRAALHALAVAGDALDTPFHVYGSLAWQHITGETCMTPESDVDLLWQFGDAVRARRVLDLLVRTEGLKLDGEALLDDGGAVAWRELLTSPARVLVKRIDGVALEASPLDARIAA